MSSVHNNCFLDWLVGSSSNLSVQVLSVVIKALSIATLAIAIAASTGVLPSVAIGALGIGLGMGLAICIIIKVSTISKQRSLNCEEKAELIITLSCALIMCIMGSFSLAGVLPWTIPISMYIPGSFQLVNLVFKGSNLL